MTVKSLLVKLGCDPREFDAAMRGTNEKLQNVGKNLQTIGKGMTAAITLPLVAIGAVAIKSALDIDKAMDQIRIRTGATGEALKGLENSAKSVAKTVPQNIMEVSKVIADLHTRTGLAGPALEALGKQTLDAARMMGVDSVQLVASFTRTLGDWGIELDKAPAALDTLFAASQATGVGLDKLNTTIVDYGAPLRQMGFSFDEAAAMVGKFEKEGVRTELVMGSLRIALGEMAREGKPVIETFKATVEQIKAAGDTSESNCLALKLFGAKAGPDMAAAIREGRFEIGSLVEALKTSGGAIRSANEDTRGFAEMWGEAKNRIMIAIEPLGKRFLEIGEVWLPKIIAVVERVINWFSELPKPIQTVILVMGGLAAAAGPVLMIVGKFITLLPTLKLAIAALTGPIGIITIGLAVMAERSIAAGKAFKNMSEMIEAAAVAQGEEASWLEKTWGGVTAAYYKVFHGIDMVAEAQARGLGVTKLAIDLAKKEEAALSQNEKMLRSYHQSLLDQGKTTEQIIPLLAEYRRSLDTAGEGAWAAYAKVKTANEAQRKAYEEMAAAIALASKDFTDVIKKNTLSEYEYSKWALEQKYLEKKAAIEEEIIDEEVKAGVLLTIQKAYNAELASLEKSYRDKKLQEKIDFRKKIWEEENKMALDQMAAAEAYKVQKAELTDAINQLTMSELKYKCWALEQEHLAEVKRIEESKTLSADQKAALLAQVETYYQKKKAMDEAAASGWTALVQASTAAIYSVLMDFSSSILERFQEWGKGMGNIFSVLGGVIKDMVNSMIGALKGLALAALSSAMKQIAAAKAEALARVIVSVMSKIPFPLNLALVGGAIAAVTALFSKIKLHEGGLVTAPITARLAPGELVLPLKKLPELGLAGMGGVNVKIFMYGNVNNAGDLDEISKRLAGRISRAVQGGRR